MISRSDAAGLSLLSCGVNVDFAGLVGKDDFESRKRLAVETLTRVLREGGAQLADIEQCFSTNFYMPVSLFNASISGIKRDRLCVDTLSTRAHCGNCDWMMNLVHYKEHTGLEPGKKYLVQSFAPGFFACGVLGAT